MFLIVDLGFLLGTAGNIFKGGWVPVVLGSVVLVVMLIWRKGFTALNTYMRDRTMEWEYIEDELEHGSLTRVHGIGVYLASPREKVPAAMASQAKILHSIPTEVYIVTVETATVPFLENKVDKVQLLPRITKVIIRVGYMQTPDVPKVLHDHFLLERERVATYYISERHFLATDSGLVSRWPERAFEVLHRNEAPIAAYFNLPGDRLISLGTRIDL